MKVETISLVEAIQKHNLKEQVDLLRKEYHMAVSPILQRYNFPIELPEDDPGYAQFLKELKPLWQTLARKVRQLIREEEK